MQWQNANYGAPNGYASYPEYQPPRDSIPRNSVQNNVPQSPGSSSTGNEDEDHIRISTKQPDPTCHVYDGRIYAMKVIQQPIRARMCGFGDKVRNISLTIQLPAADLDRTGDQSHRRQYYNYTYWTPKLKRRSTTPISKSPIFIIWSIVLTKPVLWKCRISSVRSTYTAETVRFRRTFSAAPRVKVQLA